MLTHDEARIQCDSRNLNLVRECRCTSSKYRCRTESWV